MGPSDLQPRRDLTLTHATSLVVGITIGTGIFLKSAAMAQAVGTPALVLAAWVAAGVVAMTNCGPSFFSFTLANAYTSVPLIQADLLSNSAFGW